MHGKVMDSIGFISSFDPEVSAMMQKELTRQQDGLELIASENFASPSICLRDSAALPCTFGTQLNVFSRESSAIRFQNAFPEASKGI